MIEISISQIKGSLSKYINRAAHTRERIIILSRGKPKSALLFSGQPPTQPGGDRCWPIGAATHRWRRLYSNWLKPSLQAKGIYR
jgi:prevent-host-death family protein